MSFRDAQQTRSIPSLTGLRGVAALWVMLFHMQALTVAAMGAIGILPVPVIARGWTAVDLFFVLSGFVLMRSHGDDFVRLQGSAILRFAKLRVARVYPLSFVVLLLILPLTLDRDFVAWFREANAANFSQGAFVRTALLATRWFLPGGGNWNEPVWSLSSEMLGYAAFPVLAWLLATRRSLRGVVAIGLACQAVLAAYLILKHGTVENIYGPSAAFIRMACGLVTGAAAARARVLAPWLSPSAPVISVAASVLLLVATCLNTGPGAMPLLYAVLIFALSYERGPIDRVLASAPFRLLGQLSFPLYLLHEMPQMWLIQQLQHAHATNITVAMTLSAYTVLCLGVAFLLHIGIERPTHRWGKRWANRVPSSAVASAGA